jgi:hypothetical protein
MPVEGLATADCEASKKTEAIRNRNIFLIMVVPFIGVYLMIIYTRSVAAAY